MRIWSFHRIAFRNAFWYDGFISRISQPPIPERISNVIMTFEFSTADRIVFGAGTVKQVAPAAAGFGRRVLLVTGRTPERSQFLDSELEAAGLDVIRFAVTGEPTVATVRSGIDLAREHFRDVVVAVGGGSVIDTGKVIAAMLANTDDLMEYLEIVGNGTPIPLPPVPFIAVPTTAGAGAEVTRNAVVGVTEAGVKVSMRSPMMLPRLAVVDPELTHSLPPETTAATGLDALTQLVEAFLSRFANPLADGLCREGLSRTAWALRRVCADGSDAEAREAMSLASLFGGLALANAKLGAVHGFAAPVGAALSVPHGVVCGRLLAPVMAANIRALRERDPGGHALDRYAETARILTGDSSAGPEAGAEWVGAMCADLGLPDLASFGLTNDHIPDLVAKAARAGSMKGNPVALTEAELGGILTSFS
jgi:alcohol dehydrogenase class IV